MDLVKTEIERLNKEVSSRGSVSMVFHSGGTHVCCLRLGFTLTPKTLNPACSYDLPVWTNASVLLGFRVNPKTLNPACSCGLPLWRNTRILLEFLWSCRLIWMHDPMMKSSLTLLHIALLLLLVLLPSAFPVLRDC